MCKNKLLLLSISFLIILLHCSSAIQMLPQPEANTNLLIGSLIFDIDGYQNKYKAFWDNIEIAIVGRYVKDGALKQFGQWVTTDENGYFYIANVPDGEYALKGVRVRLFGEEEIKVFNELSENRNNYFEIITGDMVYMHANFFDVKQNMRIINFKHNIITIFHNEIVDFKRVNRLQDYKLADGDIVSSPPVPIYFIKTYEESEWVNYLNLNLN